MNISGGERLLNERPEGCNVGADLVAEVEPLAVSHDGDTVVADGAADDDPVTGQETVIPHHPPGDADTGGVDDDGIEGAPLEHLGVARDEVRPAFIKCGVHRCNDPFEVRHLKTFRDDHAAREGDRPTAHHRKVVDGPADGNAPDIPAGEEDRRDYVVVGRKNDILAVERDDRPVIERFESYSTGVVVFEVRDDAQEFAHHFAAGTVHEVDFHSSSTSISTFVTTISIPATISGSFPHRGQTNRSLPS